ncbi:MAG: hypothetical protein IT291_10835 [Deltaproteobacteria bacterium]|nr:hypothetical protein [Deltaproteobacteria bacterium]
MPLRSAAQKAAGFQGGEGFQAVQDIKYAPSDPTILYMIIDTTGPWKSTNGGASWQPLINGFGSVGGQSLGIHPTDPDTVFVAGSNMAEGWTVPGEVKGIFRTTDGGSNWTKGASNCVFRSVDYGATWRNISGNLTTWFSPNVLTVNPYNSSVYLGSFYGTWKLPPPDGGDIAAPQAPTGLKVLQ